MLSIILGICLSIYCCFVLSTILVMYSFLIICKHITHSTYLLNNCAFKIIEHPLIAAKAFVTIKQVDVAARSIVCKSIALIGLELTAWIRGARNSRMHPVLIIQRLARLIAARDKAPGIVQFI